MSHTEILLFGGTTEGRELCIRLMERGLRPYVSVATGYGEELLPGDARVLCGRMDPNEICSFIKEHGIGLVIDATHPYAERATENIEKACELTGTEYLRAERKPSERFGTAFVRRTESAAEAASMLLHLPGNIFLATGVKELPVFTDCLDPNRLFVRALPSLESLSRCLALGMAPSHIVCMQGPFSREMNAALFRHFQIQLLVTKESGSAGGFEEKLEAAADAGVETMVITRPSGPKGGSLEEILARADALLFGNHL